MKKLYRRDKFWSDYSYIRPYHPHLHGLNPAFNWLDSFVISLKDRMGPGLEEAQESFLVSLLELDFYGVLSMVPGHEAFESNRERPLGRVISWLVRRCPGRFVNGCDFLIRTRTIRKLAHCGHPKPRVLFGSLRVREPDQLTGKALVLLDDVVSTGTSLRVGRQLLEECGCQVGCLALSRTFSQKRHLLLQVPAKRKLAIAA